MDQNAFLEIIRAHLQFIEWFAGGIGTAICTGATILFKYVLIPMRDSRIQADKNGLLMLARISEGIDSTKGHVIQVKENGGCRFEVAPSRIGPMQPAVAIGAAGKPEVVGVMPAH